MDVKNYLACKKDYSCKSTTCICENIKLMKSIVDNLKMVWDEVIYVVDMVSANVTKTIPINVISTVSINCHNKKVRYKMDYALLELLMNKVLFIVTFICRYHTKIRK